MPTTIHRLRSTLACCLILFTTLAQAQEERWYRVELLVFSHEKSPGGANAEQWPAIPPLAYPSASRFLVEPARVQANHEEHGGDSEVDEFGRQFITYPEPPAEDEATDIPLQQEPAPEPEAAPETAGAASEEILPPEPETPTPFVALPRSARDFDGKAAYMQRTGKYRTLFHQAWLQPVGPEATALPIVLDRSGDDNNWPRLQGSVKLHLSRYLHIETNLWLNTSGDYLPGAWRMPAPPLGPVSLIVAEPPLPEEEEVEALPEQYEWKLSREEAQEPLPEDPNAVLEKDSGPLYPFRHAILMQQKRKMRSNEVHYIDHPKLGVVVQLVPVDEEYLRALAMAEADREQQEQADRQAP